MIYEGIIPGRTVNFRSIEERDAEATLQMRMDPKLNQYLNKIEDSVDNQIAFIRKQRETLGDYLFVAEDRNRRLVGMRGITNHNSVAKTCETGRLIGIGSAVQNTEIFLFGYDFAFNILGVEKIMLYTLSKNVNVINEHIRLGSVEVGREYDEKFDDYMVIEKLTKDNYFAKRPAVYRLIERFA